MRRLVWVLAAMVMFSLGATAEIRCNLPNIIIEAQFDTVTVKYINDTDASIYVSLLALEDDDEDEDDLQDDGDERISVIKAGDVESVVLDCDDAGSLMIDFARMLVTPGPGPTAGSAALHIGEDFDCGDVITAEFYSNSSQTQLYLDLYVD